MAPTIGLGDTAILMDAMFRGELGAHVNNHPVTVAVGWLFTKLPSSDVAWRCNLVSVLFGGLTVAAFYFATWRLTRSAWVAAIVASALMVARSLWWHSTLVENYATSAFLVAVYLYLVVSWRETAERRFLYGMFAVAGLGIANHVQFGFIGLGCLAALGLDLWREREGRVAKFFGSAVSGVVGLLPWLVLLTRDALAFGSWSAALRGAFFGDFQNVMLAGDWVRGMIETGRIFLEQAPSPFAPLLIAGPVAMVARWGLSPATLAVSVPWLVNTWFFSSYDTWDRFAFLLLSVVILFFSAAFAVQWIAERIGQGRAARVAVAVFAVATLAGPPWFYAQLSRWGEDPESVFHERYNNEYTRNTHRSHEYVANPDKRHYTDVDEFVRLLLARLPQGALYVDDDSRTYYPVDFYQRYYGLRADVAALMINSWDIEGWGLSLPEFHGLLDQLGVRRDELFLVSPGEPFRHALDMYPAAADLSVAPFELDEKRWVYRVSRRPVPLAEKVVRGAALGERLELHRRQIVASEGLQDLVEQPMASFGEQWHGSQVFARVATVKGAVSFHVEAPVSGEADLAIGFTRAPDYGILEVWWNGDRLGEPIDAYGEAVALDVARYPVKLKEGVNELRFAIASGARDLERRAIGFDHIVLTGHARP